MGLHWWGCQPYRKLFSGDRATNWLGVVREREKAGFLPVFCNYDTIAAKDRQPRRYPPEAPETDAVGSISVLARAFPRAGIRRERQGMSAAISGSLDASTLGPDGRDISPFGAVNDLL